MKYFLLSILLTINLLNIQGRLINQNKPSWEDSIFNTLSLDQKIGQLMMVAAYSNKGPSHEQHLNSLIEKYHIGGVIFYQGAPKKQLEITNTDRHATVLLQCCVPH